MQSVLETFYFLFEGDAKKLNKGLEDSKKVTKDVEQSLYKVDNLAKNLGNSLLNIGKTFAGAFAFTKVAEGVKNQIESIKSLSISSKQFGIEINELDALGKSLEAVGGYSYSAPYYIQAFGAALKDTSEPINKAQEALTKLGIDFLDSKGEIRGFVDMMPDLASAFEHLDSDQAGQLAFSLGLDWSTVRLLSQGSDKVKELMGNASKYGKIEKSFLDDIKVYSALWRDINLAIEAMYRKLASLILPYLNKIIGVVRNIFDKIATNLDYMQYAIGVSLVAAVLKFRGALIRTATAALVSFAPLFLTFGTIALIAAIIEDIVVYLRGGNSITGELVKKWPFLGDVIQGISEVFLKIVNLAKKLGELLGGEVGRLLIKVILSPLISALWLVEQILDKIQFIVDVFAPLIKGLFSFVGDEVKNSKFSMEVVNESKNGAISRFGNKFKHKEYLSDLNRKSQVAPIAALNGNSISTTNNLEGNSSSTKEVNFKIDNITINSQATDSQGLATSFDQALKDKLKTTYNGFSDGRIA